MGAYLAAVWKCRFFWLSMVRMDLRTRYRGSVMGIGWSLLQPIAMTVILCGVFRVWFNQDLQTYAPHVLTGMTFWAYFTSVVLQGCGCFFQGEAYIRQFPAPMAIYPLRTVLASSFHFCIGLLLAITLAIGLGPAPPRDATLETAMTRLDQLQALPSLLPTLLLLLVFGWSVAVLFGLFNVRFRDTHHLAEIGLQGLFYLTPIMYSVDILNLQERRLRFILQCNPLVTFLDLLREPLLKGHVPSLQTYALAALIVLVVTVAAMVALKVEERRLIFYL